MYRLHMIASHRTAFSHSVRTGKLLAAWNLLGHFKPHTVMLYSVKRNLNLKSAVFILTSATTLWTQWKWDRKKTKGVSVPLWYSTAETVGHAWAGEMWAVAFICQEKKKEWGTASEREQRQSTVLWKWRLIQIQWKEGGGAGIKWSSISPPLFSCSLPLSAPSPGLQE